MVGKREGTRRNVLVHDAGVPQDPYHLPREFVPESHVDLEGAAIGSHPLVRVGILPPIANRFALSISGKHRLICD